MLPGLPEQPSRIAICDAPSGKVVYIFVAGPAPLLPQLSRRESIDGSFTPCPLPPDLRSIQSNYNWFAGVAPNNPDILYLGAYDTPRNPVAMGRLGLDEPDIKNRRRLYSCRSHAIAFDRGGSGVLYIGCDGGAFLHRKSLNRGTGQAHRPMTPHAPACYLVSTGMHGQKAALSSVSPQPQSIVFGCEETASLRYSFYQGDRGTNVLKDIASGTSLREEG